MKCCSRCLKTKSLEGFHKKGNGRQSYCKDCRKSYHREHYLANKDMYLKNNAARKAELLSYVQDLKNNPCTDCGNTFHPWAMHYDHLVSEEKDMEIGKLVVFGSKKRIDAEIEKCELVCANCHAVRAYIRYQAGVC